jgi:DNA-binding transcriptional LysR family regulator
MKIEDHRLRAFCLVVELKSFSKAAAAKFMTQSAMSHLIRSLEQDLGEKLLLRDTRSVIPTPAGKVLYAHAQEILKHYLGIDEDICALTTKVSGTLGIVSTRSIADNLLPEVIYSFSRSYQDVAIDISIANTEQVIRTISEGNADAGFFEGIIRELPPHAEAIRTDEIVLIASDSHPLARAESITPEQIAGQAFLMPEAGSGIRECAEMCLRSLGLTPKQFSIAMTIGDPLLLIKMVRAGVGIAFVSKYAATQAFRDGSVVRLPITKKRLTRKLYLMVNPGSSLLARTFKKYVREFRFFRPL